jgi:hypothetical protein
MAHSVWIAAWSLIGSGQIDALRQRVSYLWGLAGALCVGAIGACVVQRRRWNKPMLVPPLDDNVVREILATDGVTQMVSLRSYLS